MRDDGQTDPVLLSEVELFRAYVLSLLKMLGWMLRIVTALSFPSKHLFPNARKIIDFFYYFFAEIIFFCIIGQRHTGNIDY